LSTLAGILVFQAAVFLIFGFETKGRSLENVSAVADASHEAQAPLARQAADIGA
jgi:putative MFS transporter